MKFLIVGIGSIGKRHLRNLRALGYGDLLAYRSSRRDVEAIEREFGVRSFFDLEQALAEKPDVVIVSNPTHWHIPVALAAARAGAHLFLEKPLSHTLEGVSELSALVKQHNLKAMVAYPLRFYAGTQKMRALLKEGAIGQPLYVRAEVGSYLPDWRPGSDYRQVYSAHAEMGGGVLLDLSHEVDYLYWLFGPPENLTAQIQNTGALEIDAEDNVDILMQT
ncbi:MAG: gfo/Idh/MocA family oxidoreductase, partial [Anaerolineae bacterium]